jgi:hypothetical protein
MLRSWSEGVTTSNFPPMSAPQGNGSFVTDRWSFLAYAFTSCGANPATAVPQKTWRVYGTFSCAGERLGESFVSFLRTKATGLFIFAKRFLATVFAKSGRADALAGNRFSREENPQSSGP